ncbi:ATP-binding protein [Niveispirillum lacus]|uniref:sensor histidine kinase n=1 Tax=Niveispirillum lacus TaxID=1981099 RepID=UPI0013FD52B4|nr:ATP-binding protein [Niveispirillum lacus]
MAPNPSRPPLVTAPVLLLLVMAVLVIAGVLYTAARYFDAAEARRTCQRVEQMMGSAQNSLGLVLRDYAGWDATVTHIVDKMDMVWADENIGIYLAGGYRLSMTLVVDRKGQIIYGVEDGKRLSAARLQDFPLSDAMRRMIDQTVAALPGTTEAVTGVTRVGDTFYLTGAADIRPSLGGAARSDGAVLIFMQKLDRVAVARMLAPLLLEMIDIGIHPVSPEEARLPLREFGVAAEAPPVGWVGWRAPAPAVDFLAGIFWVLVLVLLALFGGTGHVLMRGQRAAQRETGANEALRHLSGRYRGLIDALPDMVCLLADGRVSLINAAGLSLLGLPADKASEVVGRPFLDLVAEGDRLIFHRALQVRGRSGVEWVTLSLVGSDGATVPMELAVLPVSGESVGEMTLVARDRRPELARRETVRAAETRAAVADRAKGQFLANISHELRTPLNAIIGFSEILRDELLGPLGVPQYREYAIDIHDGGLHLLRLVNDLLDIARMDAGTLELREGWVEVAPLIDRCERLLRQKAVERGVPVRLDVSPAGLRVLADEMRLKQIVVNLLGNAIRFSDAGQAVEVAVRLDGPTGDLLIDVADHGIGMNVDAMRIALEPFAQVEGGHNRRQPGAGLGLPLARGYAEAHGGSLTMQSTPALGTTVTVRLPANRVAGTPTVDN